MERTRLASLLGVVLATAALLGPIAVVVALSFGGDRRLHFPPESLSLRWYVRFLGDARWRSALGVSLSIAALAAAVSTAAGFLAAYALARSGAHVRRTLTVLLLLPMITPNIIAAVALYFLAVRLGLVGNLAAIALVHATLGLPVVVLVTGSALAAVDPGLERAALGLGASPWQVLARVVVPLAAPGLVSAALFAFLTSFDELVVALFLSGVKSQTLPVRIWNSLSLQLEPTIAAVSTTLIAATLAALLADWAVRRALTRRGLAGAR